MVHEFLEGISIVIYEALCCRIFMKTFLRDRFLFRGVGILFTASLAAVFWDGHWGPIIKGSIFFAVSG